MYHTWRQLQNFQHQHPKVPNRQMLTKNNEIQEFDTCDKLFVQSIY